MRGPIQGSIRDALRGALAGQLATALAALAGFQSSIALPASMGGVELLVESAVDHLDFAPERAVIGASVHVRPAAPRPEHAAPRGSMRIGGARPDPGAFAGASVVLGVEDDALNQFLQAAWLGGAFDLSDVSAIADLSGFAGAKLALRSALPPLLMPREGGAAGVDLGWGEVAFDLGLLAPGGDVRVRGFLSAILTLEGLEVDPGGRSFSPVIGPEVEVRVQVEEVNWDDLPASRAMATGMIEAVARAFLPQVLSRALRAFPLPELSLRELDPALPALVLSLRDSRMTRLESYHLVAGEVASQP
jgi:hypothetical protein